MYKLWVGLMVAAAFGQLGLSWRDFTECRGRGCLVKLVKARDRVLRVDWKPMSVFPEEAARFGDQPVAHHRRSRQILPVES